MANCIWGVDGRVVICEAPKGLCVGEVFFVYVFVRRKGKR